MTLLQQTLLLSTARSALGSARSLLMAAHSPAGLPVAAAALARGGASRKQALSRGQQRPLQSAGSSSSCAAKARPMKMRRFRWSACCLRPRRQTCPWLSA